MPTPTLTVDFTSERPTYHLRRADGTEQRATARSRESAEAVISFYKFRGYTIKRKGHKMPLSKYQKREQRHRFVKALAQLQDTGVIKGSGSANMIKAMERRGLVTRQGEAIDMTVAGHRLLAEYDPPSATLIRNQAAESSDVAVTEPVDDLPWLMDDPSDLPTPDFDDRCTGCASIACTDGCVMDEVEQPEAETQPEPEETFDWEKDQADWRAYLAEQESREQPPAPVYYSLPVRDALRVIRDNTQAALINLAVHRPTESIYQIESILTDINKLLDVY